MEIEHIDLPGPASHVGQMPTRTWEDACMIEVDLPEDETVPELVRSFAACVASVTETPLAEIPQPHADSPGAIGR